MISDLNTFIQYIAALYFTICIDGAFFRRFWSPDYYKLVTENIGQYKFQQSQTLKDKLNNAIKDHAAKIEDHSVKRGVMMLLFCIFFLIYNAFEINLDSVNEKAGEWFSLSMSSIYITGVMLTSGFSMKRWRWIAFHTLFFIVVFLIARNYELVDNNNYQFFACFLWLKIYLVILLLSPMIYQLYINWLYSQAYVQHLISTLNDEYERYLKTNRAIIDKNKDLVDEYYTKVFSDSYFDNSGQDVVITNFNQAVIDRLIIACKPPVPFVLIKKWISISIDKNNIEKIRKMESKYQFSDVELIPQNGRETGGFVNVQYDRLIEEYKKHPGVSLSKFCKAEGVDLKSFRGYRNMKLKK